MYNIFYNYATKFLVMNKKIKRDVSMYVYFKVTLTRLYNYAL